MATNDKLSAAPPLPRTYWVEPGRLLAGYYAGSESAGGGAKGFLAEPKSSSSSACNGRELMRKRPIVSLASQSVSFFRLWKTMEGL